MYFYVSVCAFDIYSLFYRGPIPIMNDCEVNDWYDGKGTVSEAKVRITDSYTVRHVQVSLSFFLFSRYNPYVCFCNVTLLSFFLSDILFPLHLQISYPSLPKVFLDVDHDVPSDLQIDLVSPSLQRHTLVSTHGARRSVSLVSGKVQLVRWESQKERE